MSSDEQTVNETLIDTVVENIMGGKKNVILDATILSTLMACARLADFRFNHNFMSVNGKSNSLECGSIVHIFMEYMYKSIIVGLKREQAIQLGFAAAETYIRGCKHCTDFKPHCVINLYGNETADNHVHNEQCILKPVCGHKVNEFPGVKNTPKDPDPNNPREKYKTGWQWVLDTCDQYTIHYRNDHWVPLEVEVVKGEVLYEDDEVRVLWKSKLDLISDTNQGIYPVDHKTMKQNRVTTTMNNQFRGQCLMMKTNRVFINKVGFQKTLKPEEKFVRPAVNYSTARLIEWQSETLPFYAKLLLMYAETGYWPENATHCEGKYGNCAFLKVCESNPDMRETEIKQAFIVGPEWNPTNDEDED